ncbi:sigma-70 family RNA polymerase sigma factor [Candidatus Peregrinibacteria bacterium]|nr:sigma-70 family RNA polymerase sigma factor [Candidatus Peregrinibacteria bacterium]
MVDELNKIPEKDIEQLVIRSQKGDSEAFSKLYDEYFTPIYRYIFFKVRKDEAEDILETLFLKAWENIKSYKKRKNVNFKSWLFRIAHNLVVDHYRLSRTHQELDPRMSDPKKEANPLERVQRSLNNESLKSALGKLKKKYRDVIVLKFINELSNEEVSRVLKKSEGSVRILQFRALKALKEHLAETGFTGLE